MVIRFCSRHRSLSFLDCNPSSECRASFLSEATETFILGCFSCFSTIGTAILLVAAAYSVCSVTMEPWQTNYCITIGATAQECRHSHQTQKLQSTAKYKEIYLAVTGLITVNSFGKGLNVTDIQLYVKVPQFSFKGIPVLCLLWMVVFAVRCCGHWIFASVLDKLNVPVMQHLASCPKYFNS